MLDLTGFNVLDVIVRRVVGESVANECKIQSGHVQVVAVDAVVCVRRNEIAIENVLSDYRSIGMRGVSSENRDDNTNTAYSRRTQSLFGVA